MNRFLSALAPNPRMPAFGLALRGRLLAHCATRLLCLLALFAVLPGAARAVDVNTANQSQLENIRGIGPKIATTIVRERQLRGPFSSYDNLAERVGGIGPKRIERLKKAGLMLGASGSAPARTARPANVIVNTPNPGKGKGN